MFDDALGRIFEGDLLWFSKTGADEAEEDTPYGVRGILPRKMNDECVGAFRMVI